MQLDEKIFCSNSPLHKTCLGLNDWQFKLSQGRPLMGAKGWHVPPPPIDKYEMIGIFEL